MLPQIGELWDGKYLIERVLGEGGMGIVFEARHTRLEQQVAVKCLLPALVSDQLLVGRFEREARAAARLRTRHVVKILDVETHAARVPYMVMELMRGRDLDAEARVLGGTIPAELLVPWLVQVAGALFEAHGAGIVHRDIKPSNIFLAEEPGERVAKLLDFGIAKAAQIVPGLTYAQAGSICGTPQYMSPEAVRDEPLDGRTDQWALGVLAYELLSGKVPFDATVFTALAIQVVNTAPTPLHTLRPDLPAALCDVVMRAMAKRVDDRFADMAAFARGFAPFCGDGDATTRWAQTDPRRPALSLSSVPRLPQPTPSGESLSSGGRAVPAAATQFNSTLVGITPVKRRSWLLGASLGVGLGVLGGIAFVGYTAWARRAHPPAPLAGTNAPAGVATNLKLLAVTASAVDSAVAPIPSIAATVASGPTVSTAATAGLGGAATPHSGGHGGIPAHAATGVKAAPTASHATTATPTKPTGTGRPLIGL